MEFTEQERIWQWCDTHQELLMQYFRAHAKDASQIELVSYDPDKMKGVLTVFNWQGVRKIVSVTPESLIDNLSELVDVIGRRCVAASEAAENAAVYANAQGDYAKTEASRVQALIDQLTAIGETVRQQGLTAEAQGAQAEAIKNEVVAWYTPFKSAAESWYSAITASVASWFSGVQADWTAWFSARKAEWNDWYSARKAEWNEWYSATVSTWDSWFASVQSGWDTWYAATVSAWDLWFAATKAEWNEWFASRRAEWTAWFEAARNTLKIWAEKEEQRQSAEEIRQEIMAHPPIPSERGYWMFWSLETTPHSYVESGYSSRGTMDWPLFFWDYSCMGVGVETIRDYSRFFIDEQGRFGMLM